MSRGKFTLVDTDDGFLLTYTKLRANGRELSVFTKLNIFDLNACKRRLRESWLRGDADIKRIRGAYDGQ